MGGKGRRIIKVWDQSGVSREISFKNPKQNQPNNKTLRAYWMIIYSVPRETVFLKVLPLAFTILDNEWSNLYLHIPSLCSSGWPWLPSNSSAPTSQMSEFQECIITPVSAYFFKNDHDKKKRPRKRKRKCIIHLGHEYVCLY